MNHLCRATRQASLLACSLFACSSFATTFAAQLPGGDANAGYVAGCNAAAEAGNDELLGKIQGGDVTVTIQDIPQKGRSRNDGNGNGEIVVDSGLSPEDTTAAILHEYNHIKCGDHGKTGTSSELTETMCAEARATQAAADGLIDAASNPELVPPFRISCATKKEMIDNHNTAAWLCAGAPGSGPPAPDPDELGTVFAEMPCED